MNIHVYSKESTKRTLIKNQICSISVKQGRLMLQKNNDKIQAKIVNEKPRLDSAPLSLLKNKSQTSWIPHGRVSGGAVISFTDPESPSSSNIQFSFLYIFPGSSKR